SAVSKRARTRRSRGPSGCANSPKTKKSRSAASAIRTSPRGPSFFSARRPRATSPAPAWRYPAACHVTSERRDSAMNQNVLTLTRNEAAASAPAAEPVGDAIASALADMGVTTIFGVISIHNMPIRDAIGRQGRIRFVPARGEAGAMNMAEAYARVSRSLGVVITSTGTAAGNAAGSQVEALTAGSPVLHITTQVDREFMDRDRAAIHDVPRQPDMLKAVSKSYFRVWEPSAAVDTLIAAARDALTAPTGPVTLEIPVDVQRLGTARRQLAGLPQIVRPA